VEEPKLDLSKTLILSLGFFASSLAWSMYNSFVPQILEGFVPSATLIGFIMTFDNIFGVVFQPLFGKWSDRTHTKWGRRMPYLLVGIPISAFAFWMIPRASSLVPLMLVIILFTFSMSVWRTPAVALMPDITPGVLRSQANGIVNLMGGIGSLLAFVGGGLLFRIGGFSAPFSTGAALMGAALLALVFLLKEPVEAYAPDKEEGGKRAATLDASEKKSLLFLLLGVFFWFSGYNAVETFFTLYAVNTLGVDGGSAVLVLSIFSLTFLLFAVPAGFIGTKYGRRTVILVGLFGVTVVFAPLVVFANVRIAQVSMLIGGFFWALVNINSLPMVVRMSSDDNVGTFVGYYYFFSFSAQIASPVLFGMVRDLSGHYRALFAYACIAFILAAGCLLFVRHGEDKPKLSETLA